LPCPIFRDRLTIGSRQTFATIVSVDGCPQDLSHYVVLCLFRSNSYLTGICNEFVALLRHDAVTRRRVASISIRKDGASLAK
jgi:hypothetical protein